MCYNDYSKGKGLTAMNVVDTMNEYFEREYKETLELLARDDVSWIKTDKDRRMVVEKTICRCLGVAQFVQYLGVEYEEIATYDIYKEKLEKLLDN